MNIVLYIGFRYRQHRRKTSEKLVVETTYGPVRGVKRISCWDDAYYSFERIPFAKPPVGELRFAEPQPPEPWTKVKKCGKEPPMPLQYNLILKVVHGAENCLFLNVYTPKIHAKKLKPVMVWIYGGGFEMGGANRIMYGPDYFMQKDVVLVTINYRVGALGFLSLKDPKLKIPGNAGLKDQIMGLQWVQANIKNFGGDPDNVTLFGESAGGASTHCLMLSPRTEGLFHKAILMSGTAFTPWACKKDRQFGFRLAKLLGYSGANNDAEVFDFLKKSRGTSVAAANGRILTEDEKREGLLFAHGPVVEPYETDQCVISKDPMLLARETWSNKIPVIMGGCANEGYIFHFEAKKLDIKKLVGECELLIPECALDINKIDQNKYDHKILKQLYFGTKDASMMPLLELMAHKHFWQPIRRTLFSRLTYASSPTYLYRFAVDSDFNMLRNILFAGQNKGTCHGDDILYLFFGVLTSTILNDSVEYRAIQQFVGMWTEFARTGNPNIKEIAPIAWSAAAKNDVPVKCLNISDEVSVIDLPDQNFLDVWDSFFPKNLLI